MIRFMMLAISLLFLGSCRLAYNFHEVDPGQIYRSAQPTYEELVTAHEVFGIKTVLNLRGERPGEGWYEEEMQAIEDRGMSIITIGMSASRLPHKEDLEVLLDALENAERPILIHCKAGADRTGEAVAIYMMEYMGKSKREALREALSFRTLHLEWAKPAKKHFIRSWEGLDWAYNIYDPCDYEDRYYSHDDYCTGSGVLVRKALTEDEDT